jgi:MFS transporter, DHA1 family, tetracycline resistance protein
MVSSFFLNRCRPIDVSAIDFAKVNPFTALMALTKGPGIAAWCGSLFLPPSLNSFCNRPGFSTQRFDSGWGPRKNGLSLFVVGIASAVGQTLLLGFLLTERWKTALLGLASSSVAYVKAPSAEVRYAN